MRARDFFCCCLHCAPVLQDEEKGVGEREGRILICCAGAATKAKKCLCCHCSLKGVGKGQGGGGKREKGGKRRQTVRRRFAVTDLLLGSWCSVLENEEKGKQLDWNQS